jgi:hypothetical protein
MGAALSQAFGYGLLGAESISTPLSEPSRQGAVPPRAVQEVDLDLALEPFHCRKPGLPRARVGGRPPATRRPGFGASRPDPAAQVLGLGLELAQLLADPLGFRAPMRLGMPICVSAASLHAGRIGAGAVRPSVGRKRRHRCHPRLVTERPDALEVLVGIDGNGRLVFGCPRARRPRQEREADTRLPLGHGDTLSGREAGRRSARPKRKVAGPCGRRQATSWRFGLLC